MQIRLLFGITLTVVLTLQAAFSQAAAESVLLNQSSAAATAKAGSALGSALNSGGTKLGNQIQNATQPKPGSKVVTQTTKGTSQTRHIAKATGPTAKKSASNAASMVTSIQGGRVTHSSEAAAAPPHN
jgi:hypothetical protein